MTGVTPEKTSYTARIFHSDAGTEEDLPMTKHEMMKHTMSKHGLLAVLLMLPMSLASGQKVRFDYSKETDFSRFKTFAWVPGSSVITDQMDSYIKTGVVQILKSKGIFQTDFSKADSLLTYDLATDADIAIGRALDPSYAASGGVPLPGQSIWLAPEVGTPATNVRKGEIVFRFLDKNANRVVWTGIAKGNLDSKAFDNLKLLNGALNKLFDEYPPKH
jgi:Domain of unknown function (DUF4136)